MSIAVRAIYSDLSAEAVLRFETPIILSTAFVTVAVALAVAQLSYWWVEMPSVALGRALARQWTRLAKADRSSKPAAVAKGA